MAVKDGETQRVKWVTPKLAEQAQAKVVERTSHVEGRAFAVDVG